ncbi:hypothetical protein GIB67_032056 [Kingdonia uniflora]|uniref:Phosphofructokinase domain-containing protein n=1 Tax=Kingdonia uniflora TaxID=39325 RepID=A0A7J7MWJ7_9MAGN|nr:hypothetical protein GIB67_032056 [Kingdonia uniflora]
MIRWKYIRTEQDFLPNLPTYPNPLQNSPAYAIVNQHFVDPEDVVSQKIVTQKNSARGVHFRRAGPQEKVYFKSDDVRTCIVPCGGLCPGINTVIREIVCGLNYMYGVDDVPGIEGGYRGFYSRNTITLTPKSINDIHKRGGDGTQKGASVIYKKVEKRGLQVSVAEILKTIDNDIALMGRCSGFIAMYVTLGSRDVDCCLIPESPFYLEGPGGLFEFIEQRLKENGHMVIVLAEGAGQEHVAVRMDVVGVKDATGNKLLLDACWPMDLTGN